MARYYPETIGRLFKYFLLATFAALGFQPATFRDQQLKYSRVSGAYQKHLGSLKARLAEHSVNLGNHDLFLRIFKKEMLLEAWVKGTGKDKYNLILSFPVCAASGKLGPKRKQGDGQVPEGFYEITSLQPQSSYHLSLRVSYPNKSDRIKAVSSDLGGDIMIHGNCVTIDCVPIQDDPIEQLYILAVETKNRNRKIPVHIFPFRFGEKNRSFLQSSPLELREFWSSLEKGFKYFESHNRIPGVSINSDGNYIIEPL